MSLSMEIEETKRGQYIFTCQLRYFGKNKVAILYVIDENWEDTHNVLVYILQ